MLRERVRERVPQGGKFRQKVYRGACHGPLDQMICICASTEQEINGKENKQNARKRRRKRKGKGKGKEKD
jgi:hypothetical protein